MSRLAYVVILRVSGRRSASGDRATVDGYVQVEIVDQVDDVVHARVVAGDRRVGTPLRLPRRQVYATREERAYYGRLVTWFCGGHDGNLTAPGERPPAPSLAVAEAPAELAYDGPQAMLAL